MATLTRPPPINKLTISGTLRPILTFTSFTRDSSKAAFLQSSLLSHPPPFISISFEIQKCHIPTSPSVDVAMARLLLDLPRCTGRCTGFSRSQLFNRECARPRRGRGMSSGVSSCSASRMSEYLQYYCSSKVCHSCLSKHSFVSLTHGDSLC